MAAQGVMAPTDSRTVALVTARAALDKLAEDVVVMDLRLLSSITDFFVLCTATSTRHLDALREHIEAALTRQGQSVWHVEGTSADAQPAHEGRQEPHWILMDCGDVVVHLLDARARDFYQLERLWGDAPRIPFSASP